MVVGLGLGLVVELLTVWGQCGCLCMEGTPRTLCTSVLEAQAQPDACGLKLSGSWCPVDVPLDAPFDAEEATPTARFSPPFEDAVNCREVRIWDDAQNGYTAVKVCDVDSLDVF